MVLQGGLGDEQVHDAARLAAAVNGAALALALAASDARRAAVDARAA